MVEKSNWLRIALLPAREAGLLQAVVHDHDPGKTYLYLNSFLSLQIILNF